MTTFIPRTVHNTQKNRNPCNVPCSLAGTEVINKSGVRLPRVKCQIIDYLLILRLFNDAVLTTDLLY
jgi:hypothetical protein